MTIDSELKRCGDKFFSLHQLEEKGEVIWEACSQDMLKRGKGKNALEAVKRLRIALRR